MSDKRRNPKPSKGHRPSGGPPPLDQARLEAMGLAYVARFATTQGKLRAYLQRKLAERGWDGEGAPAIEALVGRYVELGYIDDAAWARMKAGSLLRRGYGARRVGEALGHAGVDEDLRAEVRPAEAEEFRAALVLARRRRFGPFSLEPLDRPRRDKQVAAMLRAGHPLDIVRRIVESGDADALEAWAESQFGDD